MKEPKFDDKKKERYEDVKRQRGNNKLFCHICKGDTKQEFLFEQTELTEPKEVIFFDDKGERKDSGWTIEARVWKVSQCLGCEKINLNVFMRHSPYEYDVLIHHFPTKDFRNFPTWITYLNKEFTELVCEIYHSLNAGNKKLPLMGARTLLDMFILEKIGDVGTFKYKLKKLVEKEYITNSSRELLEVALEYGNATIHRGYNPNDNEINDVLDIIENILYSEALKNKTKSTQETTPFKKQKKG